jgi:hypothetical protein
MSHLVESHQFSDSYRNDIIFKIPSDYIQEYNWAEQKYQVGDFTALVAIYHNIPPELKTDLDQLVSSGYSNKLFLSNFFEASLLMLTNGILPDLTSLAKPSEDLYAQYCSTKERQRANDFVSCRRPDDIVVLVLKSGVLVGSMTLCPFDNSENMPSLSYLDIGAGKKRLLDVPALEVARLAKAADFDNCPAEVSPGLLQTVWIAAAFLVARDFVRDNGLLDHPQSYVCGDTHGSLISSLRHFFPIEVLPSSLRADILDEKGVGRDVAIYFLQRQVLGSFESPDDIIRAINEISDTNPKIAYRIFGLMEDGLKNLGIPSLQKFDTKKFKIDLFYFPLHHVRTAEGLNRLEKIIRKVASHRSISVH